MAPENESLKTLDFLVCDLFRYKGSHMQNMGQKKAFFKFLGHPSVKYIIGPTEFSNINLDLKYTNTSMRISLVISSHFIQR